MNKISFKIGKDNFFFRDKELALKEADRLAERQKEIAAESMRLFSLEHRIRREAEK